MKKILVVDDEKPISDIVKFNLTKEGYEVFTAYDGEEALEKVKEVEPDLILLDLMLPKLDGLEVAREVRKTYDMPIIMVTAKDSEIDKVLGLELGADDYVTKPFSNREFLIRRIGRPNLGQWRGGVGLFVAEGRIGDWKVFRRQVGREDWRGRSC